MKPFFSYYGSKWRIVPKYPAPEYPMIIEPFAGSAGYSTRYFDRAVVLVDLYDKIVQTWNYLIRVSPEEIRGLPVLKPGESLDDYDLTEDQRVYLGWGMALASATPGRKRTRFNAIYAHVYVERTAEQVRKIRHWGAFQLDYREIPNVEATYFVDPPYQEKGRCYRHKNINYSDLANWCLTQKGQVIVCENEGADWLPFRPLCETTGAAISNGKSAKTKEVFWCN